jgi:O-antigen ligase
MTTLIIAWRPAIGLAAYLIVYPMVPAEESLNMLKGAMLGLTILLFAIWLIQKLMSNKSFHLKAEYRWLFIFIIFLCFSPVLGFAGNFSLVDWARDIAPLLNLLLIPVMAECFEIKRNRWLLYLIFLPVSLSMARDILVLLEGYDFPLESLSSLLSLPVFSLRLSTLQPSLGLCIGLLMYLQNAPHKRLWLILAIVSLVIVFLTPTRTVWITTAIISLLIIAFTSRKRLWAVMSTAMLIVATGWLIFSMMTMSTYRESQTQRLEQLRDFRADVSYQNRIEEMKQAGELFLSSPIYGVGFGYQYNFWRPFVQSIGPGYLDTNFTHSDIMFLASKGGGIGLFLFGMMLYGFGRRLYQIRKEKLNGPRSTWASFGIVMIITSLIIGSSTPFYQTRWATFTFAVLLAVGLAYKETESNER